MTSRRISTALDGRRVPQFLCRCLPDHLTVLLYHRITEVDERSFNLYRRTVSATPKAFAEQLALLDRLCRVVSLGEVIEAVRAQRALPQPAVLITFDDGYGDNVDTALPILEERRMPAVVFLASDHVNTGQPFFWDLVAYLFHHTPVTRARVPLIGHQEWSNGETRRRLGEKVVERLKYLPDRERQEAIDALAATLEVSVPPGAFNRLLLTWDQVRQAARRRIDFGSHTHTHCILPGLPRDRVREELRTSKARIERELGRETLAFAYANGQCDEASETLVREAGYAVAFSGQRGPSSQTELVRRPYAIRRVPIHLKDTLPRFAAKLLGLSRLEPALKSFLRRCA